LGWWIWLHEDGRIEWVARNGERSNMEGMGKVRVDAWIVRLSTPSDGHILSAGAGLGVLSGGIQETSPRHEYGRGDGHGEQKETKRIG
jgi:hypothetical protein